jgi:hypothetical protein
MRGLARFLYLLTIPCFVAGLASAQEKTVLRFIEFRDGTVLRLQVVNEPWKVSKILSSGQIKTESMLPADVEVMSLTSEVDFDKKRQLLSYVLQLGADEYPEREEAWQKLYKMGPSICPDLKACMELTTEVEIQARLQDLIVKLYPGDPKNVKPRVVFDRFENGEPFWGYLEESPIVVVVNGKTYPLSRKDVYRVSVGAPGSRASSFQHIAEKDFPADSVEEGFEKNPANGNALKAGDNIEKLFTSKGFLLSTPIKSSFISVNSFSVAGKSGGLSIANHEPLWEGEVVIHFVQPGKPHIPAAVDHFGCWIADVIPDGTQLIGYDLQGRELGKIATRQSGTEFLAVRSDIPIHKIRIIPIVDKDANFTLDDFIFHFATSVQASHPDKVLVELNAGEFVLCKDVTIEAKKLLMHGLPAGLPDLQFPVEEMLRVNPAQTLKLQKQEGLYAELADGSLLFAPEQGDKRKMPVFARSPNLLKDLKDVVGVWTTKSGRKLHTPKPKQMAVWDAESQQWHEITYLRFLEELVLWKRSDGQFAAIGYEQFTTVWLAPPKVSPDPGSWHVQTAGGEDLVLTKGQPVSGKLSKGITANWRGQSLDLPSAQIMSIYQVPSKK